MEQLFGQLSCPPTCLHVVCLFRIEISENLPLSGSYKARQVSGEKMCTHKLVVFALTLIICAFKSLSNYCNSRGSFSIRIEALSLYWCIYSFIFIYLCEACFGPSILFSFFHIFHYFFSLQFFKLWWALFQQYLSALATITLVHISPNLWLLK